MHTVNSQRPQRLLALDILRGITIAGMLLVNNPGTWSDIYAPLRHAEWNGLTPTDLVFPFFMFIMGVSTYFSLRKYNFKLSAAAALKIVRRTVVIFAIGMAIAWLARFLRALSGGEATLWQAINNFDAMRALGVMQRLALCYGFGSIIALLFKGKSLKWVVAIILAIYAFLLWIGNGYEFSNNNIVSIVDHSVFGAKHMYSDTVGDVTLDFDPEGLLSTLPAIAHMLIGYICGSIIFAAKDNKTRINKLFIIGTSLSFVGFLFAYGMPINKKIWSPTFVITTCGLAASLLALLIWIIDIKGYKTWCRFFEAFGINPLFMYVLGSVLSLFLSFIKVPYYLAADGCISLHGWIFEVCCMPLAAYNITLASLFYAILFVCINWCFGYILYKNKIYIKI
jgi:predicted acyltransferase